jgi:hypothetical protein
MMMTMTYLLLHPHQALHLLHQCTLQHILLATLRQVMCTHSLQPMQVSV